MLANVRQRIAHSSMQICFRPDSLKPYNAILVGLLDSVGVTGFEPMTSPTRTERATNLRHTPSCPGIIEQLLQFATRCRQVPFPTGGVASRAHRN